MEDRTEKWYLDFSEGDQIWHRDLNRVDENAFWKNIGYGSIYVINHFMEMVNIMTLEFGLKFTTDQIRRLAECTPGITVYAPTPLPGDDIEKDIHEARILSRKELEEHIEWI